MSDFCKNCNPHSSYHTTAIGECLWFLICRNMSTGHVCFWKSNHAFKKHTSFVWIYSQLQIHTMLYVRILEHNFEQFSCIQKQKIYDEIFGWFVCTLWFSKLSCHCPEKQCSDHWHYPVSYWVTWQTNREVYTRLAKLSSLFSAFRKCLKLQNWYHNVLCCL